MCNKIPETLSHLFHGCDPTCMLWERLKIWIRDRCKMDVDLNFRPILFTKHNEQEDSVVRYQYVHCLKYIFCNKIQEKWPNLKRFLLYLKMLERVEFETEFRKRKVTRYHLKWCNNNRHPHATQTTL